MKQSQRNWSRILQILIIGGLSALIGILIPVEPMVGILVIALLGALIYARVVLVDYYIILAGIIFVIPMNFEGLIAKINIPFVNPFNILWISYVGIVLLRAVTYSESLIIRTPLNLPIFFVIVSFTLSFFQSKFVVTGEVFKQHIFPTYQQWLQWILFYFFCLKGIRNNREARLIVYWVMLMVLYAGLQNIRDYISMIGSTKGSDLERASGLFGNANYSASFFCYYVPVAVGLALSRKLEKKLMLFFSLTAGIGLIAVVVTYSRGGMASLFLGCALIAFFSKISPKKILILLLLVALAFTNGNIRKRFSQTSVEGPYGPTVDPSVQARLIAWTKAGHLIKEKPIIGHGFFTFRYIKVEKYEDDAAKAHGHHGMAVHNGYLNILVNAGFTGLLAFMFVILVILKVCWEIFLKTDDPFWRGTALGLFGGVICLLIVNMTGTRLYDRQMIAYLWILFAALYRGYQFYLEEQDK